MSYLTRQKGHCRRDQGPGSGERTLNYAGGPLYPQGSLEAENASWLWCVCQSLTRVRLFDPVDCSPPGSSVRGILQARKLEWVAISSSRATVARGGLKKCQRSSILLTLKAEGKGCGQGIQAPSRSGKKWRGRICPETLQKGVQSCPPDTLVCSPVRVRPLDF